MAEEDTGRTGILAVAFLAVALILLPATTADASCSAGNRVDRRDAECLSAWWKNRGLLKKSPYHVRNMCPEYGKVVAKVDLNSAMDRTIHLNDGVPRDDDMGGGIDWTVPKYGLQIELRGRGLLTHEAKRPPHDRRLWLRGLSLTIRIRSCGRDVRSAAPCSSGEASWRSSWRRPRRGRSLPRPAGWR